MKLTLNFPQSIYYIMPKIFVGTGHGLTDLVINATDMQINFMFVFLQKLV